MRGPRRSSGRRRPTPTCSAELLGHEQRALAAVDGLPGAEVIARQDREHVARLAALAGVAALDPTAAPSGDPLARASRMRVFAYIEALPRLADADLRVLVMRIAASEAGHLAALRLARGRGAGPGRVRRLHAGADDVTGLAEQIGERFAAARTDAGLLQAGLHVEQVTALAYAAAADGPLTGAERAQALRFAAHEREHAKVFETLLFALTVPVREHATAADLDALLPGLARGGRRAALAGLAELEGAAIAGHQLMGRDLVALDALRSVATVMAGGAQHLVALRHAAWPSRRSPGLTKAAAEPIP